VKWWVWFGWVWGGGGGGGGVVGEGGEGEKKGWGGGGGGGGCVEGTPQRLGDTSKTMKLGKALTASLTHGPRLHISTSSWMLFPKFTYRRTIEQIFLLNNMLQICISPMSSEI